MKFICQRNDVTGMNKYIIVVNQYQPNESLIVKKKPTPFKEVRYVSDLKYCKEME